jgi:cytochrome P450
VPHFSRLVYSAIRAMSVRSSEVMAEATADMGGLIDYVNGLLAARRSRPRQDFLSHYLDSVAEGDLDADEIRIQIVTLILAGADTTRLTLAMTLKQLLLHPHAWAALTADPRGRCAGAVAEGMRFEPVIGSLARVAVDDVELEGFTIPKGSIVAPALITALRDPAVHADPDRFDIGRTDHVRLHPIFGAGPHRCLGEALAYAELEEAIVVLAGRAPELELVGDQPRLRGLGAVRGLEGAEAMTVCF